MTGPTYTLQAPHWLWGDLPPDEEAARVAAKVASNFGGAPAPDLVLIFYNGRRYRIVRTDEQHETTPEREPWIQAGTKCYIWGAQRVEEDEKGERKDVGEPAWAPLATEHMSLPEITPKNIRESCGVSALEQELGRVNAALKSRLSSVESRVAALEQVQQHVRVLAKAGG